MRIFTAATVLSIGTVGFLALAVPRLDRGFSEAEIRRELVAATPGATLDERVLLALEEGDVEGAAQYAALATELQTPLSPETLDDLAAAQGTLATALRNAGDFAGAYVTGHADSAAGLAGAVVSDLTVVGDVRDIISEGGKAAVGEEYSEFLLTLAAVGLAAEAATIATGGSSLVVKAGISVLKVAKRTGNLTVEFGAGLVRLARTATQAAPAVRSTTEAAPAARTADEAAALTRAAARAELNTTLAAVTTVAANAGPADAVRLLRTVRTTADAQNLATFTSRFGRRARVVADLTGKATLRAFRVALRGLRLLVAFLWSFLLWLGGLVVFRIVRGVFRVIIGAVRATFVAIAVP